MGLRNRTLISTPSLYFVTTTFTDWRHLMFSESTRDNVEKALFKHVIEKECGLMGYVLMSSHLHLLVGCARGGYQLSEFMRLFKSTTARNLFPDWKPVWKKRFDDLVITSEEQLRIKLDYIHYNPVRAGIVKSPEEWKWSSARFWVNEEPQPPLTKTWDWSAVT
jgi:putative transposase